MHKIEIFLPPTTNIDSLEKLLFTTGVVSLSTTEMQVFDKKEIKTAKYRGVERIIRHNRKLKVEIIARREIIGSVVGVLQMYQKQDSAEGFPAYITNLADLPQPRVPGMV